MLRAQTNITPYNINISGIVCLISHKLSNDFKIKSFILVGEYRSKGLTINHLGGHGEDFCEQIFFFADPLNIIFFSRTLSQKKYNI